MKRFFLLKMLAHSQHLLNQRLPRSRRSIRLCSIQATVGVVFFLVLFNNLAFFRAVAKAMNGISLSDAAFMVSIGISLTAAMMFILSLSAFKYVFKPISMLLLLTAAISAYFMDSYGVMIDRSMIQNILQTDSGEVRELIGTGLVSHIAIFGLLPCIVLWKIRITYRPLSREMQAKTAILLVCLGAVCANAAFFYKDYASLFRNNRHLRFLVNPPNCVFALHSYARHRIRSDVATVIPVGEDAVQVASWTGTEKKAITVLVLGETARAANFSLNGYERETNPLLSRENIINFSRFYSCGTSTADCLPCMFSHLTRETFSDEKVYENVLDILSHAGIRVLWRENNSGCKGVCSRIDFENMNDKDASALCRPDEYYDEILLNGLEDYINKADGDVFIVLHQKGSHGPAYDLRYPDAFRRFGPVCRKGKLEDCTRQEIVNSYDNTILYTDYFLYKTIEFLKGLSGRCDTAMIYVSDHGESLGENNVYLHGLPYWIAPDEQKHIPFILWFSTGFSERFGIDILRLRTTSSREYSHDALSHSIMGLLGIRTGAYDRSLDIFAHCR